MSKEVESKDVVVDLNKNKVEDANLSDEEQEKLNKISEDLRKELGIEDKNTLSAQGSKKGANSYDAFMKQFGKKSDKTESASVLGKYDSDLDFRLNRKIRKVHLPLLKKTKIIISAVAGAFVVVFATLLGVLLYKPTAPVVLSSIALSQPVVEETVGTKVNKYYYVYDNHVGETLSYDNVYINCEYSNGSKTKVSVDSAMATVISSNMVKNGKFSKAGNCDVQISYQGNNLILRYVVSYNMPQEMNLFLANANNNTIDLSENDTSINLNNRLRVNVEYQDGTIKSVSLDKCKYFVGENELSLANGILSFEKQNKNTTMIVRVEYSETGENNVEYSCSQTFSLRFN